MWPMAGLGYIVPQEGCYDGGTEKAYEYLPGKKCKYCRGNKPEDHDGANTA